MRIDKVAIILALLAVTGFSQNYTACIDASNMQQNFSISVNNNMTNVSITTSCQFGCDMDQGKCNTPDFGFAGLIIVGLLSFTIIMFWLSHYFKPDEDDEYPIPSITFSTIFLLLGLLGILGMFFYLGTVALGYNSSFLNNSTNFIGSMVEFWGIFILVFVIMLVAFFVIRLIRYGFIGDKKRMGGDEIV
jgi:hypothetical protein